MNSTGSPTRLSPASPMEAGTLSQPAPAMDTQKATPAADKALHSRMVHADAAFFFFKSKPPQQYARTISKKKLPLHLPPNA